jgi:hypothetical protein
MRSFYQLIHNTNRSGLYVVSDYDLGDFDSRRLWHGERLEGLIPGDVRLYLQTLGRQPADLVWNPVSWPICSQRLLELILPVCQGDVEVLPAPLFDEASSTPVPGYGLLNVTRLILCLDAENSVVGRSREDGRLAGVYTYVLKADRIPPDAHLFRLTEWPYTILMSNAVEQVLRGEGLTGLALMPCDVNTTNQT